MQREEGQGNKENEDSSGVEEISSFLKFIPVVVQKRLLHQVGGKRRYDAVKGSEREGISATGIEKIASGPGQITDLKEHILSSLKSSPVPLRVLYELCEGLDFPGEAIIKEALDTVTFSPLLEDGNLVGDSGGGDTEDTFFYEGEEDGDSSFVPHGDFDNSMLLKAFESLFDLLGERRTGQLKMAASVFDALEKGKVLVVEAGTGTGKSIAYLIPSIIYSIKTGNRVVISTYTKHLQNQLFTKDVPVAVKVLGAGVKVARLMGRDNYICTDRVIRMIERMKERDPSGALSLALAVTFSDGGLVYSLSGLPEGINRNRLVPPRRCLMGQCTYSERCPLVIARNRAMKASIVLANHSLVITDYQSGGGMLGEYSCVIFDEAHNVERAAVENMVVELSMSSLNEILEPLDFIGKSGERWKFLSAFLGDGVERRRDRIVESVELLRESVADFFRAVTGKFNDDGARRSVKTRYKDGGETFGDLRVKIINILFETNKLAKSLEPIVEADLPVDAAQLQREVSFVIDGLDSLKSVVEFLAAAEDDEYVFWMEWGGDGSLSSIAASPLFVDRRFADFIDDMCDGAVLTSATLSQGGGFDFFIRRLGLDKVDKEVIGISIPSPFPFDENCGVFVAEDAPGPQDTSFPARTAAIVEEIARGTERRILVLFTSYRMCMATADCIVDPEVKNRVIVQGYGESREILAERLRMSSGGVLMGVASFWEGIDFPGEELEILVITKIPFLVPSEPIVEARAERLETLGENPFEAMQIPEAVLRLKQGVGRLIRRNEDRGVVVLLDSRLVRMRYGEVILRELPTRRIEILPMEEIPKRIVGWFS